MIKLLARILVKLLFVALLGAVAWYIHQAMGLFGFARLFQ